jgi:polyisoprenoid-binding protein YceI
MSILAETSATVIPSGTWAIDPSWSSLEFEVRKLGLVTIKGRVPGFSGQAQGGENASLEGVVDATSITTFDATRDAHIQSPDFFDTARYPELRFASTSVEMDGGEVVVKGELTIKGITKPVELRGELSGPANDPWGNERIGLELSGTVDRTDFELEWNAPLPGGGFLLPSEVVLKAYFAATRTA